MISDIDSSENTKAATSCKVADIKRQERKSKLKEQRLAREQKKLEQQQKWREKQEKEMENEINNLQNTGTIIENSPREITSTRKEYSPELNGRLSMYTTIHKYYLSKKIQKEYIFGVFVYVEKNLRH